MRGSAFVAAAAVVLVVVAGLGAAIPQAEPVALAPGAAARLVAGAPVDLLLPSGPVPLVASPRDLLAEGALVVKAAEGGGTVPAEREPLSTYVGRVAARDDLAVRLSIRGERIEGLVLDASGGGYTLVPRPDGGAGLRPLAQQSHEAVGADGLFPPGAPAAPREAPAESTSGPLKLRLALETDHGSWLNNPETWQRNALELANYAEAVYAQLGVVFEVTYVGAWTEPDPYTAPTVCTFPEGKLTQFTTYWQTHRGNVARDTAHLLAGRYSVTGGTIGCAWIYELDEPYAFGVNRFLTSRGSMGADTYDNLNLFAHELGHNFGGLHEQSLGAYGATGLTSYPGPYTIMNPTAVEGLLRFSDLDGVRSPVTGWELDNAGAMRAFAEERLDAA